MRQIVSAVVDQNVIAVQSKPTPVVIVLGGLDYGEIDQSGQFVGHLRRWPAKRIEPDYFQLTVWWTDDDATQLV